MCVDAIVNGEFVGTMDKLANALHVTMADLVIDKCYVKDDGTEIGRYPAGCLCPLDAEATANKLGWNVVFHKWDDAHSGEVEFTK